MTLQELYDEAAKLSEADRAIFLRDIRMLWAKGAVTIEDYEEDESDANTRA